MRFLPFRKRLPPAESAAEPERPGEMDLFGHLGELRKRIMWSMGSVILGSIAAYFYISELFEVLSSPFRFAFVDHALIGTGPAEAFILKLKLAVFGGAILASPVVFYQFWLFVAPGLHEHERRMAIPFVASATGLFVGGVWFCHYLVLPITFSFFKGEFDSLPSVEPTIRLDEYLSMVLQADLGFGAVSQMPLIAFFLGKLGLITHHTLIKGTRHAIVLIFVVAAVLTPPDVLTQIMMVSPLLALYGLSILLVKYTAGTSVESEEPEPQPLP